MTGSYPIVVLQNKGNINGIIDWNPYHGSAVIDEVNKVDYSLSGDPLGLDASKVANFLKIPGNNLIDVVDEMHSFVNHPAPQPKH
jgi:hypothetical protein